MTKHTIGIDILEDHLDVHCLSDGRAARFGYGATEFRELDAGCPKARLRASRMKRADLIGRHSRCGLCPAVR